MFRKKFEGTIFFGPACSQSLIQECTAVLAKKFKKIGQDNLTISNFSDGESWIKLENNVRERMVFIVQPTPQPDSNWMVLWQMIQAAKLASANKIVVIIPYCGYLRQDRKDQPRVAIAAKIVLETTEERGANRIVIMDPHFSQAQGYVNIPLDVLYGSKIFKENLKNALNSFDMVIACDGGAGKIALDYIKDYELEFGQAVKFRQKHNKISKMILALEKPEIENKNILLVDEMTDTSGTLVRLAGLIKEKKAKKICAAITHGVLSGDAIKIINESPIEKLYLLDTIQPPKNIIQTNKIEYFCSGHLFGEIIKRIHNKESLSCLF